ncbi:hypothetical protein [Anaerobutyricum soehngenii]
MIFQTRSSILPESFCA